MDKTNKELKENKSIKENKDVKDTKEQNLIKKTAKELGMTYKELGEAIGYSQDAISKSASSEKISLPLQKAIKMLIEIKELKLKVNTLNQGLENDKTKAYDDMVLVLKKFVNNT